MIIWWQMERGCKVMKKVKRGKVSSKDFLKPNGKPIGVFMVSIDNGWVEYVHEVKVPRKLASIYAVYQVIRKALRAKESPGLIRKRHWSGGEVLEMTCGWRLDRK